MSNNKSDVIGKTQRNWDYSRTMSQEHIDEIIKVCTDAPVKSNMGAYKVIVSTDRKFNNALYNFAYDSWDEIDPWDKKRNGQVDAPLLIIYLMLDSDEFHTFSEESKNKLNLDTNIKSGKVDAVHDDITLSAGISAGATALAAANLGYKTGYCGCIDINGFINKIKNEYDNNSEIYKFLTEYKLIRILSLGIGYPNANYQRNIVVINDYDKKYDNPKEMEEHYNKKENKLEMPVSLAEVKYGKKINNTLILK
tara:strand:- start:2558 stop:3313 length:756 start_codon:yes stop_codon:yes gene_type:complete